MSVLVDTPIWSLALRRQTRAAPEAARLRELIIRDEAMIIGPIRQEVLSGLRASEQFRRIRDTLRGLPDHPLREIHFERAAEFYNACRGKGIQGSNTDFLLCAVADLEGWSIFTTDRDFRRFADHVPVRLLS